MPYDPARHHRRSIRLPAYDYAQPGAYFVTLCVQHRLCLFGEMEEDSVRLSEAGEMAEAWWHHLPSKFPDVHLNAFVVMPNHVHGIIGIVNRAPEQGDAVVTPAVGADPRVRPSPDPGACLAAIPDQGAHTGAPLPQVIQWWKTMTTNAYIRGVRAQGWRPFDRRLWQRNYWERIVRTPRELELTRRYIAGNPLRWHLDRMHPERAGASRRLPAHA